MPARLQLDLTKEHLQELEALMKELGISTKKDLFNQAITLLEWAVRERKAGELSPQWTNREINTDRCSFPLWKELLRV